MQDSSKDTINDSSVDKVQSEENLKTSSPKILETPGKVVKKEGRIIEALPNACFRVLLADGKELRGFLSGKMRLNRIKILPGDKVNLEMSPYDETKGRIVYRLK